VNGNSQGCSDPLLAWVVPSVANPKFASAWATLWANFGFKATLAIY
jgi:hypothetical protein